MICVGAIFVNSHITSKCIPKELSGSTSKKSVSCTFKGNIPVHLCQTRHILRSKCKVCPFKTKKNI